MTTLGQTGGSPIGAWGLFGVLLLVLLFLVLLVVIFFHERPGATSDRSLTLSLFKGLVKFEARSGGMVPGGTYNERNAGARLPPDISLPPTGKEPGGRAAIKVEPDNGG